MIFITAPYFFLKNYSLAVFLRMTYKFLLQFLFHEERLFSDRLCGSYDFTEKAFFYLTYFGLINTRDHST